MNNKLYKQLEKSDLLNNIESLKIHSIPEEYFDEQMFLNGEYLIKQHELPTGIFLILKGDVIIAKRGNKERENKESERIVINRCSDGEIIGELAIISDNRRAADAIAHGKVETLFIAKSNFIKIRKLLPELITNLEKIIAGRLGQTAIKATNERNKYIQLAELQKHLEDNLTANEKTFTKDEVYKQIYYIFKKYLDETQPFLKNLTLNSKDLTGSEINFSKDQLVSDIDNIKAINKKYFFYLKNKI